VSVPESSSIIRHPDRSRRAQATGEVEGSAFLSNAPKGSVLRVL
jgi:hypothetical protein